MNYNQPPQTPHDEPPAESADDSPTDAYITGIVANAPTPEEGRVITAAYAKHGTAFELYLALGGVDPYPTADRAEQASTTASGPSAVEANFQDVYYGHFRDREAIIDDTIASFDWGIELRRLLTGHPELQSVVCFDRDAIWTFVTKYYEVFDSVDGLYVFDRWA